MGVSTLILLVCAWLQRHLLSIEREPCKCQTFPGLGSPDQPKAMVVAPLPIDPVVCAPEDPRWQTIPLSQVGEVLRRSHLLTHAARRESPCGVFMAFPQPPVSLNVMALVASSGGYYKVRSSIALRHYARCTWQHSEGARHVYHTLSAARSARGA